MIRYCIQSCFIAVGPRHGVLLSLPVEMKLGLDFLVPPAAQSVHSFELRRARNGTICPRLEEVYKSCLQRKMANF